MSDRINPPKFHYESDFLFPGVDPIVQTFWFKVEDGDGYPWDLKGRYILGDTGVEITAVAVESGPAEDRQSPKPLVSEPLRRMLALAPMKDRINQAEINFRREVREARDTAVARGRSSAVLDRLVREHDESRAALRPWRSKIPDSVWAGWAEDYIDRVHEWGGTYGILRKVTDERAWGKVAYETNRDRLKTMQKYDWIEGRGAFVSAATRLVEFRESEEEANG